MEQCRKLNYAFFAILGPVAQFITTLITHYFTNIKYTAIKLHIEAL